ncbi:Ankyrin repeat-containing domain [Lecanosticta acicola]|uniref:Ankyrin repeat-containing domain n=1 Tax=Lecanosticta acicola TaxID=111012 RepID=A0AAI9EFH0_9PEZI|nr:Ankyrin repeat-containing domain [Lecanosticta acicola]
MGDLLDMVGCDPRIQSAREAIFSGSEEDIRATSFHLSGLTTIGPKLDAIRAQKLDILKTLLEMDRTITEDLVAAACEQKDRECVRMLLDFGWPIDKRIYHAASLLWYATDDKDFMSWLISMGADINVRCQLGQPVLARAIVCGDIDVVHLLFENQAEVKHGDLLHCAAEREHHDEGAGIAKALVQRGVGVNTFRYDNPVAMPLRAMHRLPTPLHVACRKQNLPVAQVLVQNGADAYMQMREAGNSCPPSALEIARTKGNRELINLLLGNT